MSAEQLHTQRSSQYSVEPQNENLNFTDFANYEPYRAANRELLAKTVELLPDEGFVHVDIASGTGLVAQEMIRLCQRQGKKGKIICVEPDEYAIGEARKNTPVVDGIEVEFVRGNGETLPLVGQVDSFSMHDALHEVRGLETKEKVLKNAFDLLKPGGRGTINSAFTTIAMGEKANADGYGWWLARAFREVGGRGKRASEEGTVAIEIDESTKIYEPGEYKAIFEKAGFVVEMSRRDVEMSEDALRAIARYPRFVKGVREKFQPKEGGKMPEIEELSAALINNVQKPLNRVWVDYELTKPLLTAV